MTSPAAPITNHTYSTDNTDSHDGAGQVGACLAESVLRNGDEVHGVKRRFAIAKRARFQADDCHE